MQAEHVIDLQPSGDIQEKFTTITEGDLTDATDQTNGSKVFAGVDKPTLVEVANGLNTVSESTRSFRRTPPTLSDCVSVVFSSKPHLSDGSLHNLYMHRRNHAAVARTRARHQRTLGHIRNHGGAGKHCHIIFSPHLKVKVLTASEAQDAIIMMNSVGWPS
jgi:hypothetical protein